MADTFALDLQKFAQKAKANTEVVVRKVKLDVLTSVVTKSPVGNPSLWKGKAPAGYVGGRFRANWNVSLGSPDESTTSAIDPSGTSTIARGSQAIGASEAKADTWIVNSLPYAIPLEYGHSSQAPAGMVRITVAEFQQFVNVAAASMDK